MSAVFLPLDSQRRLLGIARRSLESLFGDSCGGGAESRDPHLCSKEYGAFVTLRKGEELRGCMGTCWPSAPLYQTVYEMTQAAASRDPRFAPVSLGELPSLRLDISVLSSLELLDDPLALEIGMHGVYIEHDRGKAVLLPQVAIEYAWDAKEFLGQTCLKAQLPENAWSWPETNVSRFSALVIEEEQ